MPHVQGWAPFALGFRPFFLQAAVASPLLIGLWSAIWRGSLRAPVAGDPVAWHAHEMLFGYTAAVIAGFLLTAVRNWTGVATWTGARLAALALLWLLGRVLGWWPGVPAVLAIGVDAAFLPLLAAGLAGPLWGDRNRANRVVVPLLVAMALAGLASQLQLRGMLDVVGDPRRAMLVLVLLLIALVGGRVLPFFTANVIAGFAPLTRRWVEVGTFAGLCALVVLDPFVPAAGALAAALWIAVGALQLLRLAGWFERRVLTMPVLWVLHAGYAWFAVGALLRGLAGLGHIPAASATHALTVGAIGVFTLGMMARVARGHTGRPIQVSRITAGAFVLVNVAAAVRVFGPLAWPPGYALWLDLSAGLWIAAFALFVLRYAPLLLRPRIDGRPG